jgi:hypothetical protein
MVELIKTFFFVAFLLFICHIENQTLSFDPELKQILSFVLGYLTCLILAIFLPQSALAPATWHQIHHGCHSQIVFFSLSQ